MMVPFVDPVPKVSRETEDFVKEMPVLKTHVMLASAVTIPIRPHFSDVALVLKVTEVTE